MWEDNSLLYYLEYISYYPYYYIIYIILYTHTQYWLIFYINSKEMLENTLDNGKCEIVNMCSINILYYYTHKCNVNFQQNFNYL